MYDRKIVRTNRALKRIHFSLLGMVALRFLRSGVRGLINHLFTHSFSERRALRCTLCSCLQRELLLDTVEGNHSSLVFLEPFS